MRLLIAISFLLLYLFNGYICTFFYGYDPYDETTFHLFEGWYYLRDCLYELMFLLALSMGLLKKTVLSCSLISGMLFLIVCSLIDKSLQNIYGYHIHDLLVILGAVTVTIATYTYGIKQKK